MSTTMPALTQTYKDTALIAWLSLKFNITLDGRSAKPESEIQLRDALSARGFQSAYVMGILLLEPYISFPLDPRNGKLAVGCVLLAENSTEFQPELLEVREWLSWFNAEHELDEFVRLARPLAKAYKHDWPSDLPQS